MIEGRNYPESSGPGAGCPTEHGLSAAEGINCRSAEGVLGDADRDQIDTMVLYPSLGLCTPTLEDPEFAAGFARLYNEWIADYCKSSDGRLHGIAVTPIEHGDVAIDIMREAKDLGLVATHIPPALKTRNLDHPDLDPFYAAAVELEMPLGIHGAPGVHLPKIGVDRFTNYIQVHCISFPFDQMTAMTALVSGGVFDRHPDLRVAFLEAGVGWVPFFIDRLHEHFEKRGDWIEGGWQRDPAGVSGGRQHLGDLRARGADPARRHRRAGRRLHHVRQRLPALGRRMAGEHKAFAHPARHQRGNPREDRRPERAAFLRAQLSHQVPAARGSCRSPARPRSSAPRPEPPAGSRRASVERATCGSTGEVVRCYRSITLASAAALQSDLLFLLR